MGDTKLLPCPFCGAPVDQDECPYPSGRRTSVDGRAMYVVNCTNNECGGQCLGWGADGARKAWNTRPALLARQEGEDDTARLDWVFANVRRFTKCGDMWFASEGDGPHMAADPRAAIDAAMKAARSGGGG